MTPSEPEADRPPGPGGLRDRASEVVAGLGLVVIVVGTFLPWLRSGHALRNSYQTDGAIRQLLELDDLPHWILYGWPAVGLACAIALALVVLGQPRYGLMLAVLIALAAGIVAVAALAVSASRYFSVSPTGPTVTLFGAAAVVFGAAAYVLMSFRLPRSTP